MEQVRIPKIVVLGGTMVEISLRCGVIPRASQNVNGNNITYAVAGPGATQAVQACLCGCNVNLISKLGGDPLAGFVRARLGEYDIDLTYLSAAEVKNTAVNLVLINDNGENAVCYYHGANAALSERDIDAAEDVISKADVCLLQGCQPTEAVVRAIRLAKIHSRRVILNPAGAHHQKPPPIDELPDEYFLADILLANLGEAADMTEQPSAHVNQAKLIASDLVARGARCAIITMGRRGALVLDRESAERIEGHEVDLVDRTGSGDAFAGALAAYYAVREDIRGAVVFASAAGALACTKFGAIEALPAKEDIIQLLQKQDIDDLK
jgi:ribokinase